MHDPQLELARRQMLKLVEASALLEVEFDQGRHWRPTLVIMQELRLRAAEAISALADVDPDDTKAIRRLQNEVQLFRMFVTTAKDIYDRGIEAGRLLDAETREELSEISGIARDQHVDETRESLDDAE
jgi:hypothetical protein